MESTKPKITMYARRTFGENLNASFDFIKENWKVMLKFTTYLILPLCLLQALSLNGLMGDMLNFSVAIQQQQIGTNPLGALGLTFFVNYAVVFLCAMIGTILLTSLIYALVKTYNEREERLEGITLSALKPLLFRNMKRMLLLILFCIVLVTVVLTIIGVLTALTPFTLLLTIPLVIACMVPLALFTPIYLFEDISLINAFTKTFRLGFATWGGVFFISIIMSIIGGVLQGVTMTPWYVATLVKYFFSLSDTGGAATVSVGYSFVLYLLAILQAFGAYLSVIFTFVGLIYQYGHASDVVDSVSVEDDIDKFDTL